MTELLQQDKAQEASRVLSTAMTAAFLGGCFVTVLLLVRAPAAVRWASSARLGMDLMVPPSSRQSMKMLQSVANRSVVAGLKHACLLSDKPCPSHHDL